MKYSPLRGSTARRVTTAVAVSAIAALSLAACAPSASNNAPAETVSADEIDAALEAGGTLTYWSWTPSGEAQVAAFEKAYPNVKVELVNAGTNTEEYTKLQNAITAGSGAPDVAQVEYYAIPQFALSDSLVDLNAYGFNSLESQYAPGPWGSVNLNGGLYGLPQDSGPMAMFYNNAVFEKYDIEVPTTWDEYIAAGKKLQEADSKTFIGADTGDAGSTTSLIWQAGGRPFQVDGTTVSVNLQDEGSKLYADTWGQLIDGDLLSPTPAWSDEWYKGLGDGSIATLVSGAWMPGVLQSSVPDGAGDWRVAPIPTYDGTPVTAENGGGGQVVLKQSKNPALAAGFLRWLNSDPASIETFLASGGFPATTAELNSDEFLSSAPEYFGGQKINEVLVKASGEVATGWQYLPYQVYANSIFGDTVGQAYTGSGDLNAGLTSWQNALIKYGTEQGFTVQ